MSLEIAESLFPSDVLPGNEDVVTSMVVVYMELAVLEGHCLVVKCSTKK